jgi:glycosyltransferase involved in cell wall biosynthesis
VSRASRSEKRISIIAEPAVTLRILRVADVSRNAAGGMCGYMTSSGAALEQRGHSVAYWFSEDLRLPGVPGKLRRIVVPWLIAARVLGSRRVRRHVDIIEIHEPLAFVYAVVRNIRGLKRLPRCVVLSYGVEERGWQAQRERWHTRGEKGPLRSRISVPLTRLAPTRVGLRHASAVLVPSTADREYLIKTLRLAPSLVVFAPTGVAPAFFELVPTASPSIGLIFVGSWIDRKGTPELVAAWRLLSPRHPDIHLTLAGTGIPTEQVLADFPADARQRVNVYAKVDRQRLEQLLASHHIFVLPSWFEGMPLSMLEAAAARLPCVVCSVCGNVDFIRGVHPTRDGGLLVPPHDSAALVQALEGLIADPDLRSELGARARDRARQFTWAHTAERAEVAYRLAIGLSSTSSSG